MGEKKIKIKWINVKARKTEDLQNFSKDKRWIMSLSMFIENYWNERLPIKARIEIENQGTSFKKMEENMVLDPQESNHFNIHEDIMNPEEWTTETRVIYDVFVTIFNALGDKLDSFTTQMGFVGEEPFIEKQEPIVYYQESEGEALDDILYMKQFNIHKIYYCAWEKKDAFYQLCDTHGIRIIDVLPYVEIKPQSIYQIEEYYGLYANHPCVERWIVAPIMKKNDYYLVKEIASKNRIEIGEYPDTHLIKWDMGFRQSRDYEESGLPSIPEDRWLFNSLKQSRPIARMMKKKHQRFDFTFDAQAMEVMIESHYLYREVTDILFGYEVLEDGISIFKDAKESFKIPASHSQSLALHLEGITYNPNCQYDINIFASLAEDTYYEKAGYIIAMEQFRLQNSQKQLTVATSDLPVRVQEKHRKLFLEGERFSCNISRQNGEMLNLALGSKEIFLKPMRIACFFDEEAPAVLQFKGYTHQNTTHGTEVVCAYKVKGHKGRLQVIYFINGKNEMLVKLVVPENIKLKSTHLDIRLNDPGDAIRYFGKGPEDNTDKYSEGSYMGLFDIDSIRVDIERCDVQWLAIGDYEFEIDPDTQCNFKIKKDINQYVDIKIELMNSPIVLKIGI